MDEILKQILGESAFFNNMEVEEPVIKLTRAVNYLAGQMKIIRAELGTDSKEYVDEVLEKTKEILTK